MPGDNVFLERPPLAKTAAERLASENYSVVLQRRLEPYRIISIGPEFLKIDQAEITTKVSIKRVTRTTTKAEPATTTLAQQRQIVQAKNNVSLNPEDKQRASEYVVDRIIRHIDTPEGS